MIEAYTKDALEEKYREALNQKRLVFMPVNVEEPQNKHFIKDFELTTRSVVVAEFKDSRQTRWKKLDHVWNYVSARWQFLEYIQTETAEYLRSGA